MYRVNDWNVSNVDYLTPKPGDKPGSSDYIVLDIPDLTVTPLSYLYTQHSVVKDSATGNSLEVVTSFDDKNTSTYFEMWIDDGTHRAILRVFKGLLTVVGSSETIAVQNLDNALHRYTITLKNGHLRVFFDTDLVLVADTTENSIEAELGIGFPTAQNGAAVLSFKYLKRASGVYNYFKPKNVDFELLIDYVDTFDSPNLKTYTKASFENIPATPKSWDPVSLVCGNFDGTEYDFNGLIQAVTVHLPQRQDGVSNDFFYKVKFAGNEVTSDYSRTYLTKAEKPSVLTEETPGSDIVKTLTENDRGYLPLIPPKNNSVLVLPEIPVADGWDVEIYNASEYTLRVFDNLGFEKGTIAPWNIVTYTYIASNRDWTSYTKEQQRQFTLPLNATNIVFDAVFNHHLPAYDDVYTKDFNSGNAADVLRGEASAIDEVFRNVVTDINNLSNFTADRDLMNQRWSNVFGLDKSLFKNSAEMRDAFQCLVANIKGETLEKSLVELIKYLTGARPDIIEYTDVLFNVLWSEEDMKKLQPDQTYYLYDEENPSYTIKPFVLYGGADQAFTWQINIYDPYNLKYNQELIKQIIEMFKPVYSYAIINFYSFEGVPYTKKYYYGIDNYLESEYNN